MIPKVNTNGVLEEIHGQQAETLQEIRRLRSNMIEVATHLAQVRLESQIQFSQESNRNSFSY